MIPFIIIRNIVRSVCTACRRCIADSVKLRRIDLPERKICGVENLQCCLQRTPVRIESGRENRRSHPARFFRAGHHRLFRPHIWLVSKHFHGVEGRVPEAYTEQRAATRNTGWSAVHSFRKSSAAMVLRGQKAESRYSWSRKQYRRRRRAERTTSRLCDVRDP